MNMNDEVITVKHLALSVGDFGADLLHSLGLNGHMVKRLEIICDPSVPVLVKCEMYLSEAEGKEITEKLKLYELQERTGLPESN